MSELAPFKVSIRLMCYNQEDFISECLDSIFMQDVDFKVEVVVGDDFSGDKTLEIIKTYRDTEFIKVKILDRKPGDEYWKSRQERGRLFNYLDILRNCSGEYIALMDGDDYWKSPNKLAKQVEFLDKNPDFSIVSHEVHTSKFSAKNSLGSVLNILSHNFQYGNFITFCRAGKNFLFDNKAFWNMRVSHGGGFRMNPYTFQGLINEKHFMATSSIMFRGAVSRKICDCFTNTNGGHYFIVMLCLSFGKGFHIPEFLGFHRLHPMSISQSETKKKRPATEMAKNRINRFNCLKQIITDQKLTDLIDSRIRELENV